MRILTVLFIVVLVVFIGGCGFPPAPSPLSSPLSSVVTEKFEVQIELLEEELGIPAQRSERAGFCAGEVKDSKCSFYFQGFGEVKPSPGKSRFWVVLTDDPGSINVIFCLYKRDKAERAWAVIQDMPFVIGYEQYPLTKEQFQRLLATGIFEEIQPEAVG